MVGHPDFNNNVSCPVPQFAGSVGTFAVGTTWGPVSIQMPAGGAYLLAVSAVTPANAAAVDITVQHYDPLGNLVYTDFFGAVASGTWGILLAMTNGPTMVRGNLYGSTIQISGKVAVSANINAWLGTSGLVASSVKIVAYSIPLVTADPEPKIFNGSAAISANTGLTPGGLLVSFDNVLLNPGVDSNDTPLIPYSGPAILSWESTGISTSPGNARFIILGYTVANGPTSVYQIRHLSAASGTMVCFPINLPACLNIIQLINADGAQAGTFDVSIVAGNAA
jgi:hypothetical protein